MTCRGFSRVSRPLGRCVRAIRRRGRYYGGIAWRSHQTAAGRGERGDTEQHGGAGARMYVRLVSSKPLWLPTDAPPPVRGLTVCKAMPTMSPNAESPNTPMSLVFTVALLIESGPWLWPLSPGGTALRVGCATRSDVGIVRFGFDLCTAAVLTSAVPISPSRSETGEAVAATIANATAAVRGDMHGSSPEGVLMFPPPRSDPVRQRSQRLAAALGVLGLVIHAGCIAVSQNGRAWRACTGGKPLLAHCAPL